MIFRLPAAMTDLGNVRHDPGIDGRVPAATCCDCAFGVGDHATPLVRVRNHV